jgi:hypothetical protein
VFMYIREFVMFLVNGVTTGYWMESKIEKEFPLTQQGRVKSIYHALDCLRACYLMFWFLGFIISGLHLLTMLPARNAEIWYLEPSFILITSIAIVMICVGLGALVTRRVKETIVLGLEIELSATPDSRKILLMIAEVVPAIRWYVGKFFLPEQSTGS